MRGFIIVLVLLLAGAGAWYFWPAGEEPKADFSSRYSDGESSTSAGNLGDVYDSEDAETVLPPDPEDVLADEPMDEPPEPADNTSSRSDTPPAADSLGGSDRRARLAAKFLSADMSQWLVPEEQVRKWVLTVDLMADGKIPTKNRPMQYKRDKFKPRKDGEQFFDTHENHRRWDGLVAAVTAVDAADAAVIYEKWLPLLEEAYTELGRDDQFDDRFRLVLDNVISARRRSDLAELELPHVYYVYSEKELEDASELQKWLWRTGAENTRALQRFCAALRAEI